MREINSIWAWSTCDCVPILLSDVGKGWWDGGAESPLVSVAELYMGLTRAVSARAACLWR